MAGIRVQPAVLAAGDLAHDAELLRDGYASSFMTSAKNTGRYDQPR
jgi:hypothetical protein